MVHAMCIWQRATASIMIDLTLSQRDLNYRVLCVHPRTKVSQMKRLACLCNVYISGSKCNNLSCVHFCRALYKVLLYNAIYDARIIEGRSDRRINANHFLKAMLRKNVM